jgi:hypothetical protein
LALTAAISVLLFLVFGFLVREQRRKEYETKAECAIRVDPGTHNLAALIATIDAAVAVRVPSSGLRPPRPPCLAEWTTPREKFIMRLRGGVAGGFPLLELESTLAPEETIIVKSAVEAALYEWGAR